jgi:RimJ/RimL family protein N-acetyltransferase
MIVKIRKLSLHYAKEFKRIIDNREIKWRGKYLSHPFPLSKVKKYVSHQLEIKNYIEFAIFMDNKFVGTICLENIDKVNKKASIGYWVAKSYRNKGIATKAVKLVVSFGFNKLKLKRIYAKVIEDNIQSCSVLKDSGFKKEGVLRKNIFKDGKFYDEYYYGFVK